MCIMAGPAEISATSILVALSKNVAAQDSSAVQRQLTAYEMTWNNTDGKANALILAVPAKAEDVELVDLSDHPKIFKKLHEIFHPPEAVMRGGPRLSFGGGDTKPYIQVQEVGSYKVSVVPSFEDLDRVDPELLTVTKKAKDALAEYAGEFCFLVAVLQDRGRIHPLAYIHPVNKHGVFVPTKHEHGDDDGGFPEWDHSVYVVGKTVHRPSLFSMDVSALSGLRRNKIPTRWSLPPSAMPSAIMVEFLPAEEAITLFTVGGVAPNHDLWL